MSEERPSGLSADLLDDFFSEADEHLLGIRRVLGQLEASGGGTSADPGLVESLFRDFHSFKGISGIVGLGPAEALAHASEDVLRLMRGGASSSGAGNLEILTAATQKLEQIVAAFRSQKPLPQIESLLADLRAHAGAAVPSATNLRPAAEPVCSGADTRMDIEAVRARGLLLWRFIFTPSHELKNQGINVKTVRDELWKMGEILKSTPVVKGPGKIVFEFLVATRQPPRDIALWEQRGVVAEPVPSGESEPKSVLPPEAPLFEEEAHSPFLAPSHVVRIDLKCLDDLMRIAGEMVIHRSRLDTQLARLSRETARVDIRPVQEVSGGLARSLRELRETISRVRLVPVAEIFARMPFVVRDLERQTGKKVRLKLEGQDTAIDKYVIERLKDPILHLVRNAFSHGAETPAERIAASKAGETTIELSASSQGDSVVIQVRDDGKGIDSNAVLLQARKVGLEVPKVADNSSILNILCSSGFSTRRDADRTAGRGVGMAVVHAAMRELGGTLALESEVGKGARFTLRLPLTLAIAEMLIVRSAGQTCAVPQSVVREVLPTTEEEIQVIGGVEAIPYRSGVLPVVRLAGLFRLESAPNTRRCLLVITSERKSVGLLVEEILGQKEVVIRALGDPLIQVPGISGATELGDGKPVLILNGAALTSRPFRPREYSEAARKTNGLEMRQ